MDTIKGKEEKMRVKRERKKIARRRRVERERRKERIVSGGKGGEWRELKGVLLVQMGGGRDDVEVGGG